MFFVQPGDIAEVKAMKNPPSGVKLVMASVCVMKSINPEKIPDPANPGSKVSTGVFSHWCQLVLLKCSFKRRRSNSVDISLTRKMRISNFILRE